MEFLNNLAHISEKTNCIFMKLYSNVYLDKEVSVKFGKSSESGVQTPDLDRIRLGLHSPSALVEFCNTVQ